jgi:acetyl-CoA carboxylase biotin carboxyl carrier protein
LNLKELKEILQLLDEKEITEFELEEQGIKLRIRKASPAQVGQPVIQAVTAAGSFGPSATPGGSAAPAPQVAAPAVEEEGGLFVVKSPIVGTFYRSPDPSSAPFVSVGDQIKVGQVLCIIEAMKLMNEIEAEVGGEVVRVVHDNGQPVQYGEPLFVIRPDH